MWGGIYSGRKFGVMRDLTLVRESRSPKNIRKLLENSRFSEEVEGKSLILIKVNLIGFRGKYGMSSAEAAAELVRFIKEVNSNIDVVIADASQIAFEEGKSTLEAFKRQKFSLAKREGAELFPLEEGEYEGIEVKTTKGTREIRISALKGDLIISFTPPKTHPVLIISASIDNIAFGMIHPQDRVFLYGGELWPEDPSLYYPQACENIIKVFEKVKPDVGIVDGLFGMEGRGPISGTPVFHQFTAASKDFVLLDSLTATLAGLTPEKLLYLKIAKDRGLGNTNFSSIISKEKIKQIKFPYRLHPSSQKLLEP